MHTLLIAIALTCSPGPDGKMTCDGHHGSKKDGSKKDQAQSVAPQKGEVLVRGEKLRGLPTVALDTLLAAPSDFEGKEVHLEAKVRKACEKKGCWMELAPPQDKGPGVRVTFKDYGFFVPTDSAGATVKVEGTVKVAELAPERAKHYEAEGATVAKGKDGKYREVQLVALGVELHR